MWGFVSQFTNYSEKELRMLRDTYKIICYTLDTLNEIIPIYNGLYTYSKGGS